MALTIIFKTGYHRYALPYTDKRMQMLSELMAASTLVELNWDGHMTVAYPNKDRNLSIMVLDQAIPVYVAPILAPELVEDDHGNILDKADQTETINVEE